MDIFWILDPDPHKYRCGSSTLQQNLDKTIQSRNEKRTLVLKWDHPGFATLNIGNDNRTQRLVYVKNRMEQSKFNTRKKTKICRNYFKLLFTTVSLRTEEDLVIDRGSKVSRLEEVNRVQVGDVHPPSVRGRALTTVLLQTHTHHHISFYNQSSRVDNRFVQKIALKGLWKAKENLKFKI